LDLLTLTLTFFFVTFSGALMPGPVMAIALTESAKKGAKGGLMVSLGHVIIEVPLMTAILFGLGFIFEYTITFIVISILGGLALLWMGYITLKPAIQGTVSLKISMKSSAMSRYGSVFGGILASVSNPWFPLWWILFGTTFLIEALKIGFAGILACAAAHWSVDIGLLALVGLFVGKGREIMSDKTYRVLIGVCGVLILTLSLYFLASGLKLLLFD